MFSKYAFHNIDNQLFGKHGIYLIILKKLYKINTYIQILKLYAYLTDGTLG